jgi:septal ring factor EnvC (AmiA/AmiB activator)
MANLGKDLNKIEQAKEKLANTNFNILGYKLTPTQLGMAFAALSTVLGTLYGGFTMYQKIDGIANLDIGAYQSKMAAMDTKIEQALDYSRDIKNGLRDDILRIEKVVDRTEDDVNNIEDKVRTLIDDAEVRFETKRDQLRTSNKADIKELEERLNAKVQRALDNPLAN